MDYSNIIKKSQSDPNYKKEFLNNPKKILKEEGFNLEENQKVFAYEMTDDTIHLVLPKKTDPIPEELKKHEKYYTLIQKIRSDAELKNKFLADPKSVLKQEGIEVPKDEKIQIIVHENTDTETHLVLFKNQQGELSDSELAGIAGGGMGSVLGAMLTAAADLLANSGRWDPAPTKGYEVK